MIIKTANNAADCSSSHTVVIFSNTWRCFHLFSTRQSSCGRFQMFLRQNWYSNQNRDVLLTRTKPNQSINTVW